MLGNEDLLAWFQRVQLPESGRSVVHQVRSSDPARRVGGGHSNVSGRYPSKKMGVTIQFESHRVELATLTTKDLNSIREMLSTNPSVFLFSCETARLQKGQSFAKSLLDHGAQAVVASTTPISAADALGLFHAFMSNAVGPKSVPVSEAFRKAQQQSNAKNMDVWVADISSDWEMERPHYRNQGLSIASCVHVHLDVHLPYVAKILDRRSQGAPPPYGRPSRSWR